MYTRAFIQMSSCVVGVQIHVHQSVSVATVIGIGIGLAWLGWGLS
jgi:hypothetical protein